MRHKMSPEYLARLNENPPVGPQDVWAHSTFDGVVSLCERRIDGNYSATNKTRCPQCERVSLRIESFGLID